MGNHPDSRVRARSYTGGMTEGAATAASDDVAELLIPQQGWCVVHLFFALPPQSGRGRDLVQDVEGAIAEASGADCQVVVAALLGHKADVAVMALHPDPRQLRALQVRLVDAGLILVDSYVSLTELSEYAMGLPPAMAEARLHPQLPPEGKPAFCFYPMSKRRGEVENWFLLDYDRRKDLMLEHGASGRKFAGRVVQVVTGSTGTDAYEWGVTLFAQRIDDLKEVVYTMRFDEASARYGDFGDFFVGYVASVAEALSVG